MVVDVRLQVDADRPSSGTGREEMCARLAPESGALTGCGIRGEDDARGGESEFREGCLASQGNLQVPAARGMAK